MTYAVPLALLVLTIALFFVLARGHLRSFGSLQTVLRVVVSLPLFVSGATHFFRTALFAGLIPPAFPQREILVILSGIMELAGGIGIILPKTSRAAALCLAILMVAIFPANIYVAGQIVAGLHMPNLPLRTAIQMIYIVLLLVAGWGMPQPIRST